MARNSRPARCVATITSVSETRGSPDSKALALTFASIIDALTASIESCISALKSMRPATSCAAVPSLRAALAITRICAIT